MTFKRLMPPLACVALLTACASGGEGGNVTAPPTMAAAVTAANAAVAAGQADKAYMLLTGAGQAFPADKTPWLRMAQMRYDSKQYGEAIKHAQAALERDPDDTLAHSIAAVSALRVASKALGDLARKNKLSGNVKTEAEELTKLLRTSLGEEVLVPSRRPTAVSRPMRTAPASGPAKTAATSASNDPFGALK